MDADRPPIVDCSGHGLVTAVEGQNEKEGWLWTKTSSIVGIPLFQIYRPALFPSKVGFLGPTFGKANGEKSWFFPWLVRKRTKNNYFDPRLLIESHLGRSGFPPLQVRKHTWVPCDPHGYQCWQEAYWTNWRIVDRQKDIIFQGVKKWAYERP